MIKDLVFHLKHSYRRIAHAINPYLAPIVMAVIATAGVYFNTSSSKSTSPEETAETIHLDTLVPEGHVLVPIEVSNMDSLDSVVGVFGLVDLYTQDLKTQSMKKVGSRLKIVRSPHQPEFISVLVPEMEALLLLAEEGPYRVAVLNPKESSGETTVHRRPKSRIRYQDKEGT